MVRLIVSAIYTVGFWVVAAIIALKSDTFPNELFLLYATVLGAIWTVMKEKDGPQDSPAQEEKKT